MDGLFKLVRRTSLIGVSIAAVLGLAGCNESTPPAPPPPPPAAYQPPPPPPALLGAPPQRDFASMAPIANPEDMSPAERMKVYGTRYHMHHHGDHGPGWWLRLHGNKAGHVAPAPASVPVQTAAPAPKVVAPPSPISQLAAAVTAKSRSAVLAVPAGLSAGKPGAVTLSLPTDLLTTIRQEAAKLGLIKAARKTDVTATLSGHGYAIMPKGPQTASLVAGKPAVFTWQVAPGANARGPLTADVSALLKGAGDMKSFSLAELKQAVAAVDAAAAKAEAGNGFKFPSLNMFSIPGHTDLTLPVVGKAPSKSVVGAIVAFLVLAILVTMARGAAGRRQAAERRRYRTMAGTASPVSMLSLEPESRAEPVLATSPAYDPADYAPAAELHVAPVEAVEQAAEEAGVANHGMADPVHDDHQAVVVEDAHHGDIAEPVAHEILADEHPPAAVVHEPAAEEYAYSPISDSRPNLEPAAVLHEAPVDDHHPVALADHVELAAKQDAPPYPVSVEGARPHSDHLVLETV